MVNIMGRMEYTKMIAGVAAAMTTQTGQIGYLGPLINDETRRLASSVYLGARYAWVNYLKKDPAKLKFKVTWIGFWFNIPGVTSDPSQVADDFFNSGYDVVVSGIDTTEATTEAVKLSGQGKKVWAIPVRLRQGHRRRPGRGPGRALLQLGPCVRQDDQGGHDGHLRVAFRVERPGLVEYQQP